MAYTAEIIYFSYSAVKDWAKRFRLGQKTFDAKPLRPVEVKTDKRWPGEELSLSESQGNSKLSDGTSINIWPCKGQCNIGFHLSADQK